MKNFNISHRFLLLTVAKLSILKDSPVFLVYPSLCHVNQYVLLLLLLLLLLPCSVLVLTQYWHSSRTLMQFILKLHQWRMVNWRLVLQLKLILSKTVKVNWRLSKTTWSVQSWDIQWMTELVITGTSFHKRMIDWLTELWFHVPPDTKWVILETFFPANLLA